MTEPSSRTPLTMYASCVAMALAIWSGPAACKIDRLLELTVDDPPIAWVYHVPPTIPDATTRDRGDAEIEAVVKQQLAVLTAPELGGRRPGSAGAKLTEAHLVATFQELGLVPDGAHRGWTQALELSIRKIETATLVLPDASAPVETNRNDDAEKPPDAPPDPSPGALPGEQLALHRDARAGSFRRRLDLVAVGHGVSLPIAGYDDYKGRSVAGKIAIVRVGWPDDLAVEVRPSIEAIDHQLEQALTHGATACIIVTDDSHTSAQWQARRATFETSTGEVGDDHRARWSGLEFTGLAAQAAGQRLLALANAYNSPSTSPTASPRDRPVVVAQAEVIIETSTRQLDDHNIVARIIGSEEPEHAVVVMAHWDAGGLDSHAATSLAHRDNTTGVAALAAVAARAQRFAREGRSPRRSLVFVAAAGGSLDAAGARQLLDGGLLDAQDVVAVLNVDTLRLGPTKATLRMIDGDRSTIRALVAPRLDAATPLDSDRVFGHHPFLEAGIPALTLTRGLERDPDERRSNKLTPLLDDVDLVFDTAWKLADRVDVPRVLSLPKRDESPPPIGAKPLATPTRKPPVPTGASSARPPRPTASHSPSADERDSSLGGSDTVDRPAAPANKPPASPAAPSPAHAGSGQPSSAIVDDGAREPQRPPR